MLALEDLNNNRNVNRPINENRRAYQINEDEAEYDDDGESGSFLESSSDMDEDSSEGESDSSNTDG